MALIKPFDTPQGVTATYHKIIKADINVAEQVIEVVLAIYASPEAREAGKSPLWHEYPRLPFSAFAEDPRVQLYSLLPADSTCYLSGATGDEPTP